MVSKWGGAREIVLKESEVKEILECSGVRPGQEPSEQVDGSGRQVSWVPRAWFY